MRALILVDLQNDFLMGGALAVPNGDDVLPIANECQRKFNLTVATQDFHPPNHGSFAVMHPGKQPGDVIELQGLQQVLWPVHCVQGEPGSDLAPKLDTALIHKVFVKGTDPDIDSYSGFFDNGRKKSTGLTDYLRHKGVTDVYIMGLATDYCVKFTALDAVKEGFRTFLIEDGCRGVNLQADDVEKAVEEMKAAGVTVVISDELASDAIV